MEKIGAIVGTLLLAGVLVVGGFVIGQNTSCIKLPGFTGCAFTNPVK